MKLLVVTLALAFFTGSQTFILPNQDNPLLVKDEDYINLGDYEDYPHLTELTEYLKNISRAVNDKIKFIDRLEISQSIMNHLHGSYLEVTKRVNNLELELPPEISKAFNQVIAVSLGVVEKGLGALYRLKKRAMPDTEELTKSFSSIVTTYAKSALAMVGNYTEAMCCIVANKTENTKKSELMEELKEKLEDLKYNLTPCIDMFESQVERFKASIEPLVSRTQQGMRRINQTLRGYLSSILATIQKYTKSLKDWMDPPTTVTPAVYRK